MTEQIREIDALLGHPKEAEQTQSDVQGNEDSPRPSQSSSPIAISDSQPTKLSGLQASQKSRLPAEFSIIRADLPNAPIQVKYHSKEQVYKFELENKHNPDQPQILATIPKDPFEAYLALKKGLMFVIPPNVTNAEGDFYTQLLSFCGLPENKNKIDSKHIEKVKLKRKISNQDTLHAIYGAMIIFALFPTVSYGQEALLDKVAPNFASSTGGHAAETLIVAGSVLLAYGLWNFFATKYFGDNAQWLQQELALYEGVIAGQQKLKDENRIKTEAVAGVDAKIKTLEVAQESLQKKIEDFEKFKSDFFSKPSPDPLLRHTPKRAGIPNQRGEKEGDDTVPETLEAEEGFSRLSSPSPDDGKSAESKPQRLEVSRSRTS
ncbi:MAG: hypothetical protein QM752_06965 [Gammaproteobacteria bacterium]